MNVGKMIRALCSLQGHMVTFKVKTPGSTTGHLVQQPVLVVQEIRRTKDGYWIVKGLDLKKVRTSKDVDAATRHYRVDRIISSITDMGTLKNCPWVSPLTSTRQYVSF